MIYIDELKVKADSIANTEVKGLVKSYLSIREMVYSILEKVPDEKLSYKPANKSSRKVNAEID